MTTIILLLISAFAIVTGASFDVSEEYLKKVTKNILNETTSLKNDIEITLSDLKRTNDSIPELIKEIPSIIAKSKAILDIQQTLKNTQAQKKDIHKCQTIFEEKVEQLSSDLQKKILEILGNQFEDAENKLSNMKEDLLIIEDVLKNNLTMEIKSCQEYGYHCMLLEAGIPDKNKYIEFVDEVKAIVNVLTEYTTNILDSKIVPARSEEIVLEPVSECLKKVS